VYELNEVNRFQLSAGLNLEKLNTLLVEPTVVEPRLKFKPFLKFFKFDLRKYIFLKNLTVLGVILQYGVETKKMISPIWFTLNYNAWSKKDISISNVNKRYKLKGKSMLKELI